jgi:hypothetical protein
MAEMEAASGLLAVYPERPLRTSEPYPFKVLCVETLGCFWVRLTDAVGVEMDTSVTNILSEFKDEVSLQGIQPLNFDQMKELMPVVVSLNGR